MTLELADRAVIALTGPETRGFLQGLITNDVELVAKGRTGYAALLTPQGKILFDFLIAEGEGGLLLDVRRSAREALVKRLSLYKLRAKVAIETRDDLMVIWGDGSADPRLDALGKRAIAARREIADGAAAYHANRLALGVPEGDDFGSDKIFALDGGLDELHAIAFDKGCYVGQELTARMKHRGTARKRLLAYSGGALAPDTPVTSNGVEIGTVTAVYGTQGFALVRLDRLEEAGALEAGGASVNVTKQAWLSP